MAHQFMQLIQILRKSKDNLEVHFFQDVGLLNVLVMVRLLQTNQIYLILISPNKKYFDYPWRIWPLSIVNFFW